MSTLFDFPALVDAARPYWPESPRFDRVAVFDSEFSADKVRELACYQWIDLDLRTGVVSEPGILHANDPRTRERFGDILGSPRTLIVGQNTAIDMVVVGRTFGLELDVMAAYDAERVGDVMLRELMIALARPGREAWVKTEPVEGCAESDKASKGYRIWAKSRPSIGAGKRDPYAGGGSSVAKKLAKGKRRVSMEAILWRRFGLDVAADKGPDSWRMRYGELVDVPLEEWPEDAVRYALEDGPKTLAPWIDQCAKPIARLDNPHIPWWRALAGGPDGSLLFSHEAARARYAYILTDVECGPGFLVDRERTVETRARYAELKSSAYILLEALGGITKTGTVAKKPALLEAHRLYDACDVAPDLTDTGRKKASVCEGKPLREWPEAARPYVSTGGHSVCWVLDPQTDDARAIVGDPVKGLGWSEERVIEALNATASPLLAAKNVGAKANNLGKVLDRFLATDYANPGFSPLLDTGRVSAFGDLPQNLSRNGGIRECLRARPGHVLLVADYGQIELVAFAYLLDRVTEYVCGYPAGSWAGPLSRAINNKQDAHILLGLRILRMDPTDELHDKCKALRKQVEGILDETNGDKAAAKAAYPGVAWDFAIKLLDARQRAKAGNYGYGGGMGPRGFVRAQAKQGTLFTLAEAAEIRMAWQTGWETGPYFEFISEMDKRGRRFGTGVCLRVPGSGLIVGGRTYTQSANVLFQGLCAQLLADAAREVWGSCHGLAGNDLLDGGRIVHFIHDEIVAEVPDRGPERNALALGELRRCMVAPAAQLLPGMLVTTSGNILERNWRKC